MASLIIEIPNQVPRKYAVPDSFTYRELQTFKTVAGVRPTEMEDALFSGDPDVIVALAMVCARRAGHNITEDMLLDLEVGGIRIEGDEDEADPTSAGDGETEPPATIPADGGTPPSPEGATMSWPSDVAP